MGRPPKIKLKLWNWAAQLSWNIWMSGLLILFFLSPLLIVLIRSPWESVRLDDQIWWAFKNTLEQSVLSGIISTFLGISAAFGLCSYSSVKMRRKALEVVLLAPCFLPALFSLVLCLTWIDPFPFGVIGISLVHAFMSFGLVAVFLAREFERELGGLTQWSFLEGASRMQLFRALIEPIGRKLLKSFFLVFAMSFSSFTVPLVVGGGRGTTLEVLIYEKIRIEGNFSAAVLLTLFQTSLVLLLSWLFFRREISTPTGRVHVGRKFQILSSKTLFWSMAFFSAALTADLMYEAYLGWIQANALPGLGDTIGELLFPSLGIVAMVLLAQAGIFLAQISISYNSLVQRAMAGLIHFSPTLIGFSSLLFWGSTKLGLSLSLCLLFYPGLWRLFAHEPFQALRGQLDMALLMGAGRWQCLTKIIIPQMKASFALMSGVMSLWVLGDFAISKLILGQESTLGILAGNLMASYRIQAAFFVTILILSLGLAVFAVVQLGAYVSRPKSS